MKKGPARSKMPVEWVHQQLNAPTTGVSVQSSLDLDLMQDEVAEIHKIIGMMRFPSGTVPNADEVESIFGLLSMDPNVSLLLDPGGVDPLADLETLWFQQWHREIEAVGTPADEMHFGACGETQQSDFGAHPVIVGTNVGMLLRFSSTTEGDAKWDVKIYFTRRRASVMELNQILLKRR